MTRQWCFIHSHDVLMFRNAKPFSAGQNFVAKSIFPPTPQTVQGIIRTHVIEQSGVDWGAFRRREDEQLIDLIGAPPTRNRNAELGNLWIQGPFVGTVKNGQIERLYPMPQDVLQEKKQDKNEKPVYRILRPQNPEGLSNSPIKNWMPLGLGKGMENFENAQGWLTETGFQKYLGGQDPTTEDIVKTDELFLHDERVGLEINYDHRRAQDKMLYHVEFARLKDNYGLLVQINEGLFNDAQGYIGTGGEGRFSYYQHIDYDASVHNAISGNVKIVLLTPAYFSDGWQPQNGNWSPWVGEDAKLVAAAIGRPQQISGWDTANRRPKPLYHCVPAGSVFYFQNAELNDQPFTETPPNESNYAALGFGATASGTW